MGPCQFSNYHQKQQVFLVLHTKMKPVSKKVTYCTAVTCIRNLDLQELVVFWSLIGVIIEHTNHWKAFLQ